jgi:hypothetical protein
MNHLKDFLCRNNNPQNKQDYFLYSKITEDYKMKIQTAEIAESMHDYLKNNIKETYQLCYFPQKTETTPSTYLGASLRATNSSEFIKN